MLNDEYTGVVITTSDMVYQLVFQNYTEKSTWTGWHLREIWDRHDQSVVLYVYTRTFDPTYEKNDTDEGHDE